MEGKESPDSSSITMHKIQVPSHGPPYLYLYGGNKVVLKVGEVTAVKEIKLNDLTNPINSCFNVLNAKRHIRGFSLRKIANGQKNTFLGYFWAFSDFDVF